VQDNYLEEIEDDELVSEQELFEHFRFVVDKGQKHDAT